MRSRLAGADFVVSWVYEGQLFGSDCFTAGWRCGTAIGANQLDVRDLSSVTVPKVTLQNSRIAALAVGVQPGPVVEETLEDFFVLNVSGGLTAGVEIPAFAQRDQLLGHGPYTLCARQGGLNPPVPEQAGNQVPRHRQPVGGVTTKLLAFLPMLHLTSL